VASAAETAIKLPSTYLDRLLCGSSHMRHTLGRLDVGLPKAFHDWTPQSLCMRML
jgi:hypothetical protein